MLPVIIAEEELQLLGEKAIYYAKHRLLLIADFHLGKVNHFRKSGIPVPQKTNDKNLDNLIFLLRRHQPQRVIFLGDLFHSHYNVEWEAFGQVLHAFPAITFELVVGNHDIMSNHQYEKYSMLIHNKPLHLDPFILSHEPLQPVDRGYNLAGHIHPAVRLSGKGRQRLKFPCFYFGEKQGVLPAFGEFTGMHVLQPKLMEQFYIVVEGKVVAM